MSKPKLIDTHAHINFNPYKDDGDEVIKRALKEDIWFINIGSQYSTSKRSIEYAEKYKEGVYAAVGLHPIHVMNGESFVPMQDRDPDPEGVGKTEFDGTVSKREFEKLDLEKYKKLLEHPKVVAMGEIGLDYFDNITEKAKEKQKQVFMEQLDLARQMDKPIIFHCRKAYNDLIELLEIFSFGCSNCMMSCAPNKLRGVIHCFMGRLSQSEKFLEMGFHISFNGLITYARDYDKVIKNTPLDRILIETDAPYLTPEPHRGKRNEPLYVKYVAEKIAEIKGIKYNQVAKQTTKNARELFGI